MRLLVLSVALLFALAACAGLRHAPSENSGLGAITAITLQKSPCYGTCPAYTVRFTADGRARYAGGRYAPLRGKFSGTVDFPSLAAWVATQHPEMLRDQYPLSIDTQMVKLTIDHGARRQTILASSGLGPDIPLRLEGIVLALDGATTRIRWRRDDAMTSFLGIFSGPPATGSAPATAVDIDQSVNGKFYAFARTLQCGIARPSLARDGNALRLRCASRSSVLRATPAGFDADGDALPAGSYRRIDPHDASVLWGDPPQQRLAE